MATKTSKTKVKENVSLGLFSIPENTVIGNKKASSKTKDRLSVVVKKKGKDLKRFYELAEIISNAEAEKSIIEADFKSIGSEEFIKFYDKFQSKPQNFLIKTDDSDKQIMFMVKDQYAKLTDESKDEIEKVGAKDMLETINSFAFDPEIFSKHHAELSAALNKTIMGLKGLTDYEKLNLVTRTSETRVKKGSINELGFKKNKKEIFNAIHPTLSLKSA